MISKNTIKFIKSLQIKKFRHENGLFVVEGFKSVFECLTSDYEVVSLYSTAKYVPELKLQSLKKLIQIEILSENEMASISNLENNFSALAVLKIKKNNLIEFPKEGISLALDYIQDPGNLGTIIRTADWFGIKNIYCSANTVDIYSPKVISATMGSFLRVNVEYVDLNKFLSEIEIPIMGAFMNGLHPNKIDFKNGVLLMGNEANGISKELVSYCTHQVSIPKIGKAESLNVAMATGIIMYEICK